jgi:hypothetical protein
MRDDPDISIEDIVLQHPKEYSEGLRSQLADTNPYPQSFHFDLTVNDCKHIAWREGRKVKMSRPEWDEL